jgi:hypothetical protein
MTAADLVLQRGLVHGLLVGGVRTVRPSRGFVLSRGRSLPPHAFHPPPRVESAVPVVRRR